MTEPRFRDLTPNELSGLGAPPARPSGPRDITPEEMQGLGLAPPPDANAPDRPPITLAPEAFPPPREMPGRLAPPTDAERFVSRATSTPYIEPGVAGRIAQPLTDWLGAKPEIDPATGKPYPEIGPALDTSGVAMKSAGVFTVEPDDAKRAKWLTDNLPGTKSRTQGREVIVTMPDGKDYSMNRIGPSPQDFAEFLYTLPHVAGIGRLIGLGKTATTRTAIGGAASGADVFGSQRISQALDTGRVPDLGEAALATGMGAAFTFGGEKLWNWATKNRGAIVAPGGTLTPEATITLKAAGIDPDAMSADAVKKFAKIATAAENPAEAARLARAQSLGFPVSKGDISQDPKIQAREFRLQRGASPGEVSSEAERMVQNLRNVEQPKAFGLAQSKVSERVTGAPLTIDESGKIVTPKGESFAGIQDTLASRAAAEKTAISAAYKRAQDAGGEIASDKALGLSKALWKSQDTHDVPEAKAIARDVARKLVGDKPGERLDSVAVIEFDNLRKRIVNLQNSSNPRERASATALKRAYDDWEQGLSAGDFRKGGDAAIAAFQEGRGLRAKYGARYEDNDAVAKIIERAPTLKEDGSRGAALKLTPSEAADTAFGATLGKRGAPENARHLKTLLGEDSAEWAALKREALTRALEGSPGTIGEKFRQFVRKNPELAKELFTTADIREITALGALGRDVFYRAPGTVNYASSGLEMLRSGVKGFDLSKPIEAMIALKNMGSGAMRMIGEPPMSGRALASPTLTGRAAPFAVSGSAAKLGQDTDPAALARRILALPPVERR